jgi:alpha-galactosidase
MTYDEYVTHFSMWALLKSPLILGNDVTNMVCLPFSPITIKYEALSTMMQTDETLSIITNDALINISQDHWGSAAHRLWKVPVSGGELSLWRGGLSDGYELIFLRFLSLHSSHE